MKQQLLYGVFSDGSRGSLLIENGIITSVNPKNPPESCIICDFGENYILPAFIEIHAHGGAGYDFIDNTTKSFDAIFESHLSHGVTSLCPTLCACDFNEALNFLELCRQKKSHPGFVGVHLEGPFLSPQMCGAQNLSCLRDPSFEDIEAIADYADVISRITVAPELSGTKQLAKRMLPLGVKLSIGHSAITSKDFAAAIHMGFDSVTHLYSSMRGRYKEGSHVLGGLIEAALADDTCCVELIGDGHHVSRENLLLTLKCKGADHVALVSDAMRAAGQVSPFSHEFGESFLGAALPENRVILEDGVAKLPDRSSFAGSLAIGDTMVQALTEGYGLSLETVSAMMSTTPARMLGLSDRGQLKAGLKADITILNQQYETIIVFRNGEIVYHKENEHA